MKRIKSKLELNIFYNIFCQRSLEMNKKIVHFWLFQLKTILYVQNNAHHFWKEGVCIVGSCKNQWVFFLYQNFWEIMDFFSIEETFR